MILIDEYDKPLLDVFDSDIATDVNGQQRMLEDRHREVLKAFYSTFKAADADLQFVFLTGVTKFSQITVFSGFNQPNDISMDAQYETLCGISEEEVDRYFTQSIQEMAIANGTTFEDMRDRLRQHYDGYQFSKKKVGMYNPFSLLCALQKKDISNYWFSTGTPTYLMRLLSHARQTINELVGGTYKPDAFIDYKATAQKPLPMIYQSGYLTIKRYNPRSGTYVLDFPNNEVKEGVITALMSDYFIDKPTMSVGSWLDTVVNALDEGRPDDTRKLFKIGVNFSSKSGAIDQWEMA